MTIIFGFFTAVIIHAFIDEYPLSSDKKEEVVVIEKMSKKSLFLTPTYFVSVQLPGYGGKLEGRNLNRVTKKQLEELEIGDSIEGFRGYGLDFFTTYDIVIDGFLMIGLMSLFGTLTILGIVLLITEIPAIDRLLKNGSFIWPWIKGISMASFLVLPLSVAIYYAGRWFMNMLFKIVPWKQMTTNAEIVSMHTEKIKIRRSSITEYYATVEFEDAQNKVYQVIKEITSHTYSQSDTGEIIEISYRSGNPYDIFLTGTSGNDIVNLLFNFKFMMLLIGTLFFIWVLFGIYKNGIKKRMDKGDLKKIFQFRR